MSVAHTLSRAMEFQAKPQDLFFADRASSERVLIAVHLKPIAAKLQTICASSINSVTLQFSHHRS